MKILNINSLLNPASGGGTAERTIQMSRFLCFENEIDVSILTLDLDITSKVCNSLEGVKIITIPCLNRRFLVPSIFNNDIAKSIKDADIIHLMGHWNLINLLSFFWIKKYKKPYAVCPAGALPIFGRSKLFKRIFNFFGGRYYIKVANANIAITKDEINHFKSYGVDEKKITLLPNGVDPTLFKYTNNNIRQKLMIGENPFILFVGRLNLIKGPDLLLEAFSRVEGDFENYSLIFAGKDDGLQENLQAIVKKYELEKKVRFIGFVENQLKSELYHAADLLVIPSRFEAMSIVVLESAISGTPVMMTDTCGLEEFAGINGGYLVRPEIFSIERGLRVLLSNRGNLFERGEQMKSYVESFFSWSLIIRKYVKLYDEINVSSRK